MRNMKWLVAAVFALPAAGCVESVDQSYGYSDGYYSNGYANSGYYSPGYYATPSVNNYYYTPAPTVVTQTRYVPVPTPVPVPTGQADRDDADDNGEPRLRARDIGQRGTRAMAQTVGDDEGDDRSRQQR